MSKKLYSLYERLPEIYKELDAKRTLVYKRLPEVYLKTLQDDSTKAYQLRGFLELFTDIFHKIYENIESLYHNFFIETCDPWVIPYIGDLLGISHLKIDSWNQRANVADNIRLLRKKGTLSAIEELTYDITKWGVYCLELQEKMLYHQNINVFKDTMLHQGSLGNIPTNEEYHNNHIVTIQDPSLLGLMKTNFDPFGHIADLKPLTFNNLRYNIPNLAIFLWRLKTFQVYAIKPKPIKIISPENHNGTVYLVPFSVHPLGRPVRLFNISKRWSLKQVSSISRPTQTRLVEIDEAPGKILTIRLNEKSKAGNPLKYVKILRYNKVSQLEPIDVGITLYIPDSNYDWDNWPSDNSNDREKWVIRGEDLSKWEKCVFPPLENREVAIDPKIGRILIGVRDEQEANALKDNLYLNYTYGNSGDVGSNPAIRRKSDIWDSENIPVSGGEDKLEEEINKLSDESAIILIKDSLTYTLHSTDIKLKNSLYIRADDNQRPIIELANPLEFSPFSLPEKKIEEPPNQDEQLDTEETFSEGTFNKNEENLTEETPPNEKVDNDSLGRGNTGDYNNQEIINDLVVRLEGLYITRKFRKLAQKRPLIGRVALNRLEIINCTLDPGGYKRVNKSRATSFPSMHLYRDYGFPVDSSEKERFLQIPEIKIENSICGPLLIEDNYSLYLKNSIIDDCKGVGDNAGNSFAIEAPPERKDVLTVPWFPWGPPTFVDGITIFGKTHVKSICGKGAIFIHPLKVQDVTKGCLQHCYISGERNQIPQIEKCVHSSDAYPRLQFVDEEFGEPGYAQLAYNIDNRIKEYGPNSNAMGAYGYLCESDKWRNLILRFREFMPVGIRPLFIVKS